MEAEIRNLNEPLEDIIIKNYYDDLKKPTKNTLIKTVALKQH